MDCICHPWLVHGIELFRLVTLPDDIVVAGSILPPMYMRVRTFHTNRYALYDGRTALVKPHPKISQPMSIHTILCKELQLWGELGSISSYGERRPASGNNLCSLSMAQREILSPNEASSSRPGPGYDKHSRHQSAFFLQCFFVDSAKQSERAWHASCRHRILPVRYPPRNLQRSSSIDGRIVSRPQGGKACVVLDFRNRQGNGFCVVSQLPLRESELFVLLFDARYSKVAAENLQSPIGKMVWELGGN
jgi:hypothetical protein